MGYSKKRAAFWLLSLMTMFFAAPAHAAIQCYECHGSKDPIDYRPVDDLDRNAATGGFPGNHRSHISESASPAACAKCHPGSDNYISSHEDGKISLSPNINFSPLGARYKNTTSAFLRTANPALGTCTNVNCHFEKTTLPWGSPSFAAPQDCNRCHGAPPDDGTHTTHDNYYGPGTVSCANCHSDHVTERAPFAHATSAGKRNLRLKGFAYSKPGNTNYPNYLPSQTPAANRNGTCSSISCHGNTAATWGGSSLCLDCHSVSQGNRAAIAPQFSANSHHIQGTVTNDKCYQCHWEANSDGSINSAYHHSKTPGAPVELVVYGAGFRPIEYSAGTTAVQYTANGTRGEIQKINTHCLGCHSDPNNATQPFGDGKTPKQYAWDGTSVAARYGQTAVTTWGKYSTVANAAQKRIAKAYSAHGNAAANKRGWDTTTGVDGTITNTGGTVNVQCYDCHNSHGSTVTGTTTRYASATANGGILKDTTAGIGGYAVAYKPYTGGSTVNKNRRNPGASLCIDCHLNQTADTTPWGYASTFGAAQPVLGYWDAPYYQGYSTAGAEQRYSFKKINSVKGGHFGASSPLSSTPMGGIDGLCTPCHDPHGVSPTLGGKQQYAVPLLKGTWLTSPYKEDVAPANNAPLTNRKDVGREGVPYHIDQNTFSSGIGGGEITGLAFNNVSTAAGLCLGCHPRSSLTDGQTHDWKGKNRIHESVQGWKTAPGNPKHSYTCSKCHSPHNNSVLPRLMVTNCLNSPHKGRTGWASAVISGSGHGQFLLNTDPSLTACSEIPYSFRRNGYAPLGGGYGWCGTGGYPNGTGSGGGRIPGNWSGDNLDFVNNPVACHEGQTGTGTDQSWNTVTPWEVYPPMTISTPTATVTGLQASITWATNIPGSSTLNYGLIPDYGNSATGPSSVVNHTVALQNLVNHAIYHYKVTSIASDGQQMISGDSTFYTSVPPSVPTLIAQSSGYCASSCTKTVQWNAATDPDGGPIEYQVQVDTSNSFNTANLQTSPWIPAPATNWSPTLSTNNTWYWRVQARDANHSTAQDPASGWSTPGSFIISNSAPTAPVIGVGVQWALSTSSIRWYFTDTANNEDGFKLHDSTDAIMASSAIPNGSYIDETGLTANTQYTRHVHAFNGGGDSPASANVSRYTLSVPPNVTASITAPAAINASGVTFTNAAGFGAGGVQYYRTYWDRNPTYSFGSYSWWGTGTATWIPSTEGAWYFHVQSRNGNEAINGQMDYGPYYYDLTPPSVTSFAATTPWNTDLQIPITSFTASDTVSGVTGYMITTSASPPLSYSPDWKATPPATYSVPAAGTYTLYPWAKDLAGNVSAISGSPLRVVIMRFDVTPPVGIANADPADNATNLTTSATLKSTVATDGLGGPVQYWFQVALDSGFTSGVQNSGWLSGPTYSPTALSINTTYYWRVKARDESFNETAYTTPWSFTPSMIPVTWTSKGDFETNAATTTTPTARSLVTISGLNPTDDAGVTVNSVSIVDGGYHVLSLKNDGTVWAWGYNAQGQLGDGTTTQRSTPAQVSGLAGVISVAAGTNHSLAVKSDGTVWAWGYNYGGQLGDGSTTNRLTPVQVSGLTDVISVAAGGHSLAIKSDGTVWSWGSNQTTPVQVSGLTGVISVAAGVNMSLALKSDGTVWSWNNPPTPVQVSGLTGVTAVAAGNGRYVAVKSDGTVWSWGNGPLGNGTSTYNSSIPVQVSGLTGISAVAAGDDHSLALKSDGTVWAWGNNTYGQLGDNTYIQRDTPVQVWGFTGATAIAGGSLFSLAVKSDGTVWAWGYSGYSTVPPAQNYRIPVSCNMSGVSFLTPGTVSSLKFNAGYPVNWGTVSWSGTTPVTTAIKFRTRGAATEAGLTSATWSSFYAVSGSTITTPASQWLETELTLQPNGSQTPRLDDFSISYHP